MGTDEKDSVPAAQQPQKEQGSTEKENESPAEHPPGQASETTDPLNTYKWHTGSKGTLDEVKEEGEGGAASSTSTVDKIQKASTNKWSKMQNWRKALSEDNGDKNSSGKSGEATKADKGAGGNRKNPFRRALSEPPGSLFAALSPSSSSANTPHAAPSSTAAEASGVSSTDPSQRGGGGALFKKYLRTVSQKLKRPKLQSRSSTPSLLPDPSEAELPRLQWAPPQEVPLWDISNCVLEDGQIFISPEEEPTMWTRNRVSSCLSNLSMQNLVDIDTECSPDHVGLGGGPRPKNQDGGVRALIKRRLENKAKRNSNTQLNPVGLNKGNRHYGSRESVSIPVSPVGSLDLSADTSTVIRPVHSSILGEKYCFEVINSENTHCFGCSSAAERDRWIEDLRRAAQPNKDNIERTENSLSLWVNEAKDLPPKRRYYCEVHLDGTLFARTSSRSVGKASNRSSLAGDSSTGSSGGLGGSGGMAGGCQLFWGEFFELDNLPCVSQITLHLFREEDPKKKRHSRDEFCLHPLGSVAIPLAEIRGRTYQEKWYPITPYKATGTAGKELVGQQASLRIKARFQNLKVLPMEKYKEFAEYVTLDYVEMCRSLEPLLNVKEKEELAGALVHVLQSIGKAKEFLIDLGSAEVERLGEKEALIFRENTLATKAIDEYMKLVGQKYLIDTLGEFITRLYASMENCEVDPRKCHASELSNNQKHLRETCEEVVQKIIEKHGSFPEELHKIFSSWVELCEDQGRAEIGQRLISASLFLRFLCPAILSPSLFGLTQPYPEPNTLRTLTLTAKVIQNLANFTLFGEKEEYMLFMNEFLEQHWDGMRGFLQTVSNPDTEMPMTSFDGYVDLPLRLAVLHGLLVDIIYQRNQDTIDRLHPLPSILNQITESLGPEAPRIIVRSEMGQVKPVYVPPKDLGKYSPHQSSLQQLPVDSKGLRDGDGRTRRSMRERKPVTRTQSAPHRRPGHTKHALKRQISSETLPTADNEQEMETNEPLISSPKTSDSIKRPPAPVPWIKDIHNREPSEMKTQNEQFNLLDRHAQELSELRLGIEQVTERELDMAKRLEDFIIQSQDQNVILQTEVNELRSLLAVREEQLASATFRLGVIEEEREEDERKLSVAIAAAERMNVLEEQFAGLMKDLHQLSEAYNSGQNNIQHPEKPHINSN
ncbi:RAS protein activator like-3 isoform X1 [Thunnus maccoyii]|uniref:RAS protein activator like-3 isoform X1 n=1 Tax=Thunnus maccoyii TaxID=8240 RepID=UPI001C4C400A|nr:RAS protein activator like-3 isoform X1 [Thunnus maccoyii]XP_042251416.1 RAS protein activator like-3 isoform X1 [Thunnus maccoyii]XP_042251423.1 RAS protein activator like-3 isoform X1 [Thunnus maccoyii]